MKTFKVTRPGIARPYEEEVDADRVVVGDGGTLSFWNDPMTPRGKVSELVKAYSAIGWLDVE